MKNSDFEQAKAKLRAAAKYFANGQLDNASIEDAISKAFLKLSEKPAGNVRHPKTYLNRVVESKVKDMLRQRARRKTDQLEDFEGAGLESGVSAGRRSSSPDESCVEALARLFPERLEVLEKCFEYIGLLYSLRRNRVAAEHSIIPISRSINALKEAKNKIDDLGRPLPWKTIKKLRREYRKIRPLPAGYPHHDLPDNPVMATEWLRRGYESIQPYPRELQRFNTDYFFFREDGGEDISKRLEKEIEGLEEARRKNLTGPGTSPQNTFLWRLEDVQFDDSVISSIHKLRADPIMLILRVLYKMFKIGSGKYGARKMIRNLILELKSKKKGSKQELLLFQSVTEETDFETLRKKIYKKTKNPFYDKLAGDIYSACSSVSSS